MRIYCDGIYDLLHVGHIEMFQHMKNLSKNAVVVIGIISDKVATSYKRKPIITEEHRLMMLEQCKYIDEVITDAPLIITKIFLDKHNIDMVVHGFADEKDIEKQKKFFKIPIELNKFKQIPYSTLDSTTSIIKRIKKIEI